MIIDAHTHISVDGKQPIASVDNVLHEMKLSGVNTAVVFPLSDHYDDNIKLANLTKDKPLIPLAFINPHDKNALGQLRECIETYHMRGLKLHPILSNFNVDDHKLLDDLFKYCDEKQLNIVIHCTTDDPREHPYRIGTMASMFPNATFQIAHMGAIWAADAAIEMAAEHENVYLDTGIASSNAVRRALEKVPEKILMGCDFPFYFYEMEKVKIRKAAEYAHSNRENAIDLAMGENCRRLYHIG